MNQLAEEAIRHELEISGAQLEEKLKRTLAVLQSYRPQDLEEDIEAFAKAEVTEEDPLRARMEETADQGS